MTTAREMGTCMKSFEAELSWLPTRWQSSGKADAGREVTAMGTSRTTVGQVQASRERSAEITSGRAIYQQGLAATCKDPPNEGQPKEAGGSWSDA